MWPHIIYRRFYYTFMETSFALSLLKILVIENIWPYVLEDQ